MDVEEMIKGLKDTIGATAEMAAIYRNALLRQGFDQKESLDLTKDFVKSILLAGNNGEKQ